MSDRKKAAKKPTSGPEVEDAPPLAEDVAVNPMTGELISEAPKTQLPEATQDAPPEWANVPQELRLPRGRQVIYVRFRGTLTDTPWKGERQVILWPISIGDKRLASQRSQGDSNRFADEIAKQMIRAIDGHMVDWTGNPGPGNVDVFWEEVGERGRTMLQRMFVQLHVPSREEMRDFFENCIAVRVAG